MKKVIADNLRSHVQHCGTHPQLMKEDAASAKNLRGQMTELKPDKNVAVPKFRVENFSGSETESTESTE